MRRSMLFLPGATPSIVVHGATLQADSIIIDLEDAVSPLEKDAARILTKHILQGRRHSRCETIVRINGLDTPFWRKDLDEVLPGRPDMILCPKINGREDLETLDAYMGEVERRAGLPEGGVKVMCLIETARGVENAYEIAGFGGRVAALFFGASDFSADMRIRRTEEGTELLYARSRLVNACRSHGIDCYDTPYSDVENTAGLIRELENGRSMGFTGKAAINPRQVPLINQYYSPSPAEIAEARAILEALDRAEKQGRGVVTLGSRMIDAPDILKARQVLAYEQAMKGDGEDEE